MKSSASVVRCGLFAALLSVAGLAAAQDLRFMSDSPYVHFSAEDKKIFHAALEEALEKGADGEARPWSNPASRANGVLTPVKSFERKDLKCRRLSIANKAKGRSASGEYNFCKQASGKWTFAN